VERSGQSEQDERERKSKRPEEASENIRKSQGDDATDAESEKKTGNRPAFDRDR